MCSLVQARARGSRSLSMATEGYLILNKWYQSSGSSIDWIQRQVRIQERKNQCLVDEEHHRRKRYEILDNRVIKKISQEEWKITGNRIKGITRLRKKKKRASIHR
ncbi:hypothetical protein N665_0004s0087 [Sinapis alba]|nr:hypothetical protein N665_0004s0087 [Sinapis alba]